MTGIEMMRSGQRHTLYHFDAQQQAQTRLYSNTGYMSLLPFNHPAFELLMYWPISGCSYRTAIGLWAALNIMLVLLIAWLLAPSLPILQQVTRIPLALFAFAFYPVVYVLGEGQDSIVFLLLLVLSLRATQSGRQFLAGFLLALGCFKFHLAILIAFFVFGLRRKWGSLAGFGLGGALVAGISLLMVGPAFLRDYPNLLRSQSSVTPWGFIPWFMPNLRGFLEWALAPRLDTGLIAPFVFMTSAIIALLASWLVLRSPVQSDEGTVYSVAILTTILISYHFHMQDLTIAVLPMLLLIEKALGAWSDRRFLRHGFSVGLAAHGWTALLVLALTALYLYRIAGEALPILVIRGCVLAVPIVMLWMIALRGLYGARGPIRGAFSDR